MRHHLSTNMLEWITLDNSTLWWLVTVSIISFFGTLILVPVLIIRLPRDYFTATHRQSWSPWAHRHPVIRWAFLISKNILGIIFIILGLAMLLLPGQGILTLLIGIMFINFPGKYRLERKVVSIGPILRNINKLRARAGREPLEVDH